MGKGRTFYDCINMSVLLSLSFLASQLAKPCITCILLELACVMSIVHRIQDALSGSSRIMLGIPHNKDCQIHDEACMR